MWTIEGELLKISNKTSITDAAYTLGLLPKQEKLKSIDGVPAWFRGGSETYIYPFSIITIEGATYPYILKAIVSLKPQELALSHLITKRRLLKDASIRVPQLIYSGEALILEEFIPYSIEEVLKKEKKQSLVIQVIRYAGILDRLGFQPIDAFKDLRTDGNNLVPVDFGEDLGDPSISQPYSMHLYDKAIKWLKECKLEFSPDELRLFQYIYYHTIL